MQYNKPAKLLKFGFTPLHLRLGAHITDSVCCVPIKTVKRFRLNMEQFVDTKQVARSTIMVHKQLFLPGTVCC